MVSRHELAGKPRAQREDEFIMNLLCLLGPNGQSWLQSILKRSRPSVLSPGRWRILRNAFLLKYAPQVRSPGIAAREQLVSGQVRQGDRIIESYTDHFHSILERCRGLPRSLQCEYYRQGLHPSLAAACLADVHGNEWTDLQSLVNRAHLESRRIEEAKRQRGHDTPGHADPGPAASYRQ